MNIKISEYNLPIEKSGPYGITVGPDGAIWFAEEVNKIGQLVFKNIN
ncbi:hypothetical protein [Sporosalibacterium faouarense]|nr:hypothetical protein [Sporosalibacterium faouarense]